MRVVVDHDLCEGNGVCEQVAPEVFRLGDDDRAWVLVEYPGGGLRPKVESAVRRCPRQAIRLRSP
jgi:ferredoxin